MTFLGGDPLTDMNPAGTLAAEGHNDRHTEANTALREIRGWLPSAADQAALTDGDLLIWDAATSRLTRTGSGTYASEPTQRIASPSLYQVDEVNPCDDLTGWTATNVTATGGVWQFAASSSLRRSFTPDPLVPTYITCELTQTDTSSSNRLYLRLQQGTSTVLGAMLVSDSSGQVSLFDGSTSFFGAALTRPVVTRLHLLYIPATHKLRGWFQDDATSGPTYLGEIDCSGAAGDIDTIGFVTGSYSGTDGQIDNLVIAPMWAVTIGDSRTAGHNTYDPFPGRYAGADPLDEAWPYVVYQHLGAWVVNSGVGSTSPTSNEARFDNQVLKFLPRVAILDSSNYTSGAANATTYKEKYAAMAAAADAAGVQVVLTEAPPIDGDTAQSERLAINTYLRQLAAANGYTFVPWYDELSDGSGNLDAPWDDDGVHLSVLGRRLQGQRIAEAIA